MSFQSISSDDFSMFPEESLTNTSIVHINNNGEYVVNDDAIDRRDSASPTVDETSVDLLLQKEDAKHRKSTERQIDSVEWTINDLISSPTSTCEQKSSGSTLVSSPSASLSWDAQGTNPDNWNTHGTNETQNVIFTSDNNNTHLQQNQEHFSDAYDKVSFDCPPSNTSQMLTDDFSRNGQNDSGLAPLSTLPNLSLGGLDKINNQCYQAAISEHFKSKKHSKISQYISKIKISKSLLGNAQLYDKHQRSSPENSPTHSQQGTSHIGSQLASPVSASELEPVDTNVTKASFSMFTIPNIPSPTGSQSSSQSDGPKSPKSSKDPELKKFRYNQTALALQQSGLMKTTIKTAELLRKSRLLQQELTKLRKETAVFMSAVLNNPENKHLRSQLQSTIRS